MANGSKILFSKEEIHALNETEFFRVKRRLTEKIFHEYGEIKSAIESSILLQKISFPHGTDFTTGKISKGENYLGLPFIILDFPRLFTQKEIFAFRTMVWWGNFVSCTLLLSGELTEEAKKRLPHHFADLKKKNTFLCIQGSPWHHHMGNDNYLLLSEVSKKMLPLMLKDMRFLKVARNIPIQKISRMKNFSVESFELFMKLVL